MQIAGIIIGTLVTIRLVQSILSSVTSQRIRDASAAQSATLLDEQIAATRALRIQREQQCLHWNGYRKFRVGRKTKEAAGTTSLYLMPHDGKPLPRYLPGQYLTFRFQMPDESHGDLKPVIRCYSLSDAPRSDYFRITVKRVPAPEGTDHPPGRISNHVQDSVQVGDILDVQAPRGDFALEPHGAHPVVLIGGGVGVTPVLSMLNAIVQAGSTREVWFFYGVRNNADHMMQLHLQEIAEANPNVHLFVCYSSPTQADEPRHTYHHSGHVTVDVIRDVVKVTNFDFYICGPPSMMDSLVPALQNWGVAKDRIHTEAFGPAAVKKKSPPKTDSTDESSAAVQASVQFSRTGKTVSWDESAGSLLDLALNNGIAIDSGCRAGSCGTCLVAVKRGSVRSNGAADAECGDGSCLACVSVPAGDIVLDA